MVEQILQTNKDISIVPLCSKHVPGKSTKAHIYSLSSYSLKHWFFFPIKQRNTFKHRHKQPVTLQTLLYTENTMAWVWLVIDSVHKSQLFARQTASNRQGQRNTAMCILFIVWRVLLSLHSLQTASSQLTVSQRSAIASIWVAGYHDIAFYSHKPKSVGTQWLEHQESGFFLVLVSFPAQSCLCAIAVRGIVGVFTRVCEWECLTHRAKGECHVTHSNSWPEQRLMARVAGSG